MYESAWEEEDERETVMAGSWMGEVARHRGSGRKLVGRGILDDMVQPLELSPLTL